MLQNAPGTVLGLNANTIGGAWKCLVCGYYTAGTAHDCEDGSIPTCGQRKTQYCAGPCQDMRNFEWSTQSYYVPPVQQQQMEAQRVEAIARQQCGLPVGQAPPLPSPAKAETHPTLPDVSGFTEEELVELKRRIDEKLEEKKICAICCERPKTVIFYPCKHKVACKACSANLKDCPQCRETIADRIEPFE